MKNTLNPPDQKPEFFLDTEASAQLAKAVDADGEKAPAAAAFDKAPEKRLSRLLDAFYYWILSR
jgi:hypothetical protein